MSATINIVPRNLLSRTVGKVVKDESAIRSLALVPPLTIRRLQHCTDTLRQNQDHRFSSRQLSLQQRRLPSYPKLRSLSTTRSLSRDHHFDTLKLVQRLKDEGFSEDQSKAMMLILSDVIEESIQNLTRTMVLREGQLPSQQAP